MISFNEIIECLPPGKSYRRKRYNSFDANIGNEENLDPANPSEPCDNMKPDSKKVNGSRKCDDTDDEISFRDIKVKDGDHEDTKTKYKRKSNTEHRAEMNWLAVGQLATKDRRKMIYLKSENIGSDRALKFFLLVFLAAFTINILI